MTMKIRQSSEMIRNFKQAALIDPQHKFRAVQTDEGHSLLFSIGTDNVFYLTREAVGQATGWVTTDLSSGLKSQHGAGMVAKTFAVAQNARSHKIDLVLVVTAGGEDFLYLSLGNSGTDAGWAAAPDWTAVPYDDPGHHGLKPDVAEVYVAESRRDEYIAVDVSKPGDARFIYRYFIDPTGELGTGQKWNGHDVGANLAAGVQSCLGRKAGDRVDGIYSLGKINGEEEMIYMPLYNPWDVKVAPNPTRLKMPPSATAIAVVRAADGKSTDLFVAADKALYYFAAGDQDDSSAGLKVFENDILAGVKKLYAHATATRVVVWGLNRADQVFYTTCPPGSITDAKAWSYPLPLLKGVEQLTTYVNRVDDANTFFAHTGGSRLQKAVQSTATTLWTYHDILLPPPEHADKQALGFDSYTTRVHVTDENNTPLPGTRLRVAAVDRAAVYVNHVYYVLDTEPIEIETDGTGGVTIVEKISGLGGTALKISAAGHPTLSINPMDKPRKKLTALDTKGKLSAATIEYDHVGKAPKPLVAPGTSDQDKQAVVDAIRQLETVSDSLPADGSVGKADHAAHGLPTGHVFALTSGPGGLTAHAAPDGAALLAAHGIGDVFEDAVEVFAGDLVSFLEDPGESFEVFIQAAEDAWHFVVKIAGKAFRFVIDCARKVVHALEMVFRAIATFIEDLINYLKFAFQWHDFLRTRDVFKKIMLLYLQHFVEETSGLKVKLKHLIDQAQHEIDDWADIQQDSWTRVNYSDQILLFVNSEMEFDPFDFGPAMMWFSEHVISHIFEVKPDDMGTMPRGDDTESLIGDIVSALEDEGDVFRVAVQRIGTEILPDSQTMSLADVLKKLSAIVIDAVLDTGENFIDLLIEIFVILAEWAIGGMTAKIRFVYISDLLEDFGIDFEFSFLDLICMIGAVPATIGYKTGHGHAPFSSDDGFSDVILEATKLEDLRALEPQTRAALAACGGPGKQSSRFVPIQLPDPVKERIFFVGHVVSGIVALGTAALVVAEADSKEELGSFSTAIGISQAVSGVAKALPAIFARPYPIENPIMSGMSSVASFLTVLSAVIFKVTPPGIKALKKMKDASQIKTMKQKVEAVGAGFSAFFALVALLPTIYHFYELSQHLFQDPEDEDPAPAAADESNFRELSVNKDLVLAAIDEISNVCGDLSRICAFCVKVDADKKTKGVLSVIMVVLIASYGLLQISEPIADLA